MKQLIPLLAIFFIGSVNANTILTSIRPIQMISYEITQGVTEPDVLLDSNTSPHDYALKPSDIKRIRSADLVIWFGQDLEPFLSKVLEGQTNILTISEIEGLELREFSGNEHEHDSHHHGSHDPHFWLGQKQSLHVAKAISQKLSEVDPSHKEKYQSNYQAFVTKANQSFQEWQEALDPVKSVGYYVFHDAYGYFEQDYGLNHLGHFTVTPDRKPGAKTLIHIRKTLAKGDAKCVFSEPQFTPAVIESVTRGSKANIGELDPLGSQISVGPNSYFAFLQSITDSFTHCLRR
ncbi:zinc ABC transporter substrate-binding protein ZnuA [Vibrio ostreicida]|uniref:High-affinity zinc uptake system protein ZnuA n=1 Tax=Vibrio ostreicida TaxID=526588 RepID=A0ABT8BU17_9VIBR|nr:zinc ABC transporter substrate-binding protein ZnuA [Vibrio ostreicida]MDN3610635.1 zinc ABC transporter substrate-binding protein ZnuA [Vibrio ostreicida]NPD07367.1 zinc ABC transporter substrate-binding protein ZnuA [Vibrio ostreicida]